MQKVDQAIHHYREAVRLNDQNIDAYLSLGNVQIDSGKFDDATETFQKVLELDPENYMAQQGILRVQQSQKWMEDPILLYSLI